MTEDISESRRRLVATLAALCLAAGFIIFFAFNSKEGQELAFMALTLPAVIQIKSGMADFKIARKTFLVAVPYLLSLTLSFLFNIVQEDDNFLGFMVLINIWYAFFIAAILGSWRGGDLWADIMRALLVLAAPAFVYVLIHERNAFFMGRWRPYFTGDNSGAHPNWWGLMALGLGWCALAWQNFVFRFAGLIIAAYFIFLVQSRGSLIALIPAFIFGSGYFVPLTVKRFIVFFLIVFIAITAVYFEMGDNFLNFITNDVMKMNDPERGLGTGMTGRTTAYEVGWKAFLQSPFFGNGVGEYEFVHNGFLLLLAESGIFALLGVFYMLLVALRGYLKAGHWAGIGYIVSYMTALMTFPRSFNINMTSLLIIMVIMRGAGLTRINQKPYLSALSSKRRNSMNALTANKNAMIFCSALLGFILLFTTPGFSGRAWANSAPVPAESVGYTLNTFSANFKVSNIDMGNSRKSGFDWYMWNFGDGHALPSRIKIDGEGSVTLEGDVSGPNGELVTATTSPTAPNANSMVGVAFGGGGYFEAELSFNPKTVINAGPKAGWPSFWGMAVELLAQRGTSQWPGQPLGYTHFIEVDFMEYDMIFSNGQPNYYGSDMHDWYGIFMNTCKPQIFCDYERGLPDLKNEVPASTDFTQYHRYGFLWVPATSTQGGYGQFFFDGAPIGKRVNWVQMDNVNPPPNGQLWTFSIIDKQHLVLALGTGIGEPMKVKSVNVWQATDKNNLKY